jgi:hypothetical protein
VWSDAREAEPSSFWVELPDNGRGTLMGWVARRETLRRHPFSDAGRAVTDYIEHAGVQQPFEQPLTAADRQGVDDDIDLYLLDADLTPRPRGYVWMIRVPDGHTSPEAFLADVDTAIIRAAGSVTDPKQLLFVFGSISWGLSLPLIDVVA